MLNEIYHNLYTKDQTIDFYTHSRMLFCLVCNEIREIDLMISTANSLTQFMKRNSVFFKFEKKTLRFISRELRTLEQKTIQERVKKFEKLKTDFDRIFESTYERKVLNYFDYNNWIDVQISRCYI
jgi:hypothetical protein